MGDLLQSRKNSAGAVPFSGYSPPPMITAAQEGTAIDQKIQELCEAIVSDIEVQNAREQAESFLADEDAMSLYREMVTAGRSLHQMQHAGQEPSATEVQRFTDLQNSCEAHPGVTGFMEAQDVLRAVAEQVNRYVTKSLEMGRVPTAAEMAPQGGCGEGCGCH